MKSVVQLLKLFLIPLAAFSLTRGIFYLWNIDLYEDIPFSAFIYGIHFDISATCMIFGAIVPFYFLANKLAVLKKIETTLFVIALALTTLLNLIDTAFIHFSQKRSGQELIDFVSAGEEFLNLLPSYIIDYWFLFVVYFAINWAGYKIYKKIDTKFDLKLIHILQFVLIAGFIVLGIRGKVGGFSSRPLNTNDAAKYAKVKYVPVLLNSTFSLIKSFEKNQIKPNIYFSNTEVSKIFNPIHQFEKKTNLKPQNIVVLILESFSAAYIGKFNDGIGYTPFLDSLIDKSLFFNHCYANGTHSAEAVPSIFASIPALIDEGLIFSEYANIKTNSLPEQLAKEGYYSAFFHGANNGSMHFDAYTAGIGFNNYFGRDEYNNEDHFDGKWGIFDHHFYNYSIEKISNFKEPFLASIFSLSSHHPYNIPANMKQNFDGGDLEIHKSIEYADWSLSQFFKQAKTQDWYKNTLFVLTADHTSYTRNRKYKTMPNNYNIPLLLFHPTDTFFQQRVDSSITMHIDIFPSLMDYSGINDSIICFGNSIFKKVENDNCFFALSNSVYQLVQNDYLLQFDGTQSIALYNIKEDEFLTTNLIDSTNYESIELKLKAIVQQFNNRLISNKLSVE